MAFRTNPNWTFSNSALEVVRADLNLCGIGFPISVNNQAHPTNFAQCYLRYFDPSCWTEAYKYFKCAPAHKVLRDHYEDFLLELNSTQLQLQQIHYETPCLDIEETVPGFYHVRTGSLFSPKDCLHMDLDSYYAGMDYRLYFCFLPLVGPIPWWPSLYFIMVCLHAITQTALHEPAHLFLLAFGAWKLPSYPCPILSPAANELQPVFFSYLILILGKIWIQSIDQIQPYMFKKRDPFVELDSDVTPTSSQNSSDSDLPASKTNGINRSAAALQGDILLDDCLNKLLKAKHLGVAHSQRGPLRDFLRSAKVQIHFAPQLGIQFPPLVSGNPPSKHLKSSIVEQELTKAHVMRRYLELCELEIGAQLNREHFTVPIRNILT